jgi:ribosomal protein L11 methyltransferase
MDWLRVQIDLGRLPPEPVETALSTLGAVAVEYRDAGDEPLLEPAPGETPLWQEIILSALLPVDCNPDHVRLAVAAAVTPSGLPPIRFETLEGQDWVGRFRDTLKAQHFGHGLWVIPPGTAAPTGAAANVQLEPGLAFGSGKHATTALCLEWLAGLNCHGDVLDFGCGSGVLALAALALGARHAVAVDIDPQARQACAANARRNGAGDRIHVTDGSDLATGQQFDAVVANILSGPLIELAPKLAGHLRPGAAMALSGILSDQAPEVVAAFEPWIDFAPSTTRDDWVLLAGRSRVRI